MGKTITDVLVKVCTVLNVGFEDVMELMSDSIVDK